MTDPRQAGGRGGAPVWSAGWAGLTLAASDSCTSSSTDSARQDRLSKEPRRRRPPHWVAIAARPSSPHSPEPPETCSRLGLRLGLLRQHFRLGLRVTGRAGSTAKSIRPGNGSRCEGSEAARCWRRPGLGSGPGAEGGLCGGPALALQSFGGLGYLSLAPKQWELWTAGALGSPPSQGDPQPGGCVRCRPPATPARPEPLVARHRGRSEPKPQELMRRRPIPANAGRAGARRGDGYGTGRAIPSREAHPCQRVRDLLQHFGY